MARSALTAVHRRRLAVQFVTSAPADSGAEVVRRLLAVQAQDAPMAAWSLGLRLRPGTTYADVLAEQAGGGWVRTHVLRPTWHFVAPADLRWLQRLTGPKVERSLAARHRQLGLDGDQPDRAVEALHDLLSGGPPQTRRELTAAFAARGLPASGEQMGHQLLVAELRAVVCSGPPRGAEHTYVLVDDAVPAGPHDHLDDEAARTALVRRFVHGHGPATDRDLVRWSTLTLTQVRAALAELEGELEPVDVGDDRMWVDPAVPSRATRRPGALLVPAFDELTLTYADHGFPRRDPTSPRPRIVNAIGGGSLLLHGEDLASWSRTVTRSAVAVRVSPDLPLDARDLAAVERGARRLARFVGHPLDLTVGSG